MFVPPVCGTSGVLPPTHTPSETILSRLALAWRAGLGKSGWGSRRGMPSSSTVGVEGILRDSSVTGGSSPLTCPQPGRGPACGSRGLALQGPPCCPLWLTGPLLQEKTLTKRGHLCFLGSRTGRGSVVKSVFKPVAMEVGWKDSGSSREIRQAGRANQALASRPHTACPEVSEWVCACYWVPRLGWPCTVWTQRWATA